MDRDDPVLFLVGKCLVYCRKTLSIVELELTYSGFPTTIDIVNNITIIASKEETMNDVNTLLKTALGETKNLKEGESFLVKDLFKGYLWNRIPRGDRLLLGSMFLSYVASHASNVTVINKGASGQQRYLLTPGPESKN